MTLVSRRISTFAGVISAPILIFQGAQASAGDEVTKKNTPCDSAHYLIKLAAEADSKLCGLLEKAAEAQDEQQKIELYAATADVGANRPALAGLLDNASRRVATLAKAAVTCRKAVAELTRTLHIEAGRKWLLADATQFSSKTGTATAMSTTASGDSVAAHLKLDKLTDKTCAQAHSKQAGDIKNDPVVVALEQIKVHKLEGKDAAETTNNVCKVSFDGPECSTGPNNIKVSTATTALFKATEHTQVTVKPGESKAGRDDQPQRLKKELEEHQKNLKHRLYDFLKNKPCDRDMASVRNMAIVQTTKA
uniref:Variant surface glycoprotein 1125.1513 n=1 Tax=Trypanosoma brucei TaxID=5691 RepID=A0A1J0R766_9TRYP|nr:variant surface glycoprotein 1125.1513 [Trypanosoma brucei]